MAATLAESWGIGVVMIDVGSCDGWVAVAGFAFYSLAGDTYGRGLLRRVDCAACEDGEGREG